MMLLFGSSCFFETPEIENHHIDFQHIAGASVESFATFANSMTLPPIEPDNRSAAVARFMKMEDRQYER